MNYLMVEPPYLVMVALRSTASFWSFPSSIEVSLPRRSARMASACSCDSSKGLAMRPPRADAVSVLAVRGKKKSVPTTTKKKKKKIETEHNDGAMALALASDSKP